MTLAVAAGLWLLGSAAPLAWQQSGPAFSATEIKAGPSAATPITAPAAVKLPESQPHGEAGLDEAAGALAARLGAAGLDGALAARRDGAVVRVAGRVPLARAGAWREVRMWYDTSFGAAAPLVAEVEQQTASDAPPFSVRALWLGTDPYFLASDGRRYEPGSVTRDGWTVRRIAGDGILLQRRGETLRLAL